MLVVGVALLVIGVVFIQQHVGRSIWPSLIYFARPVLWVTLLALIPVAVTWRRYKRSGRVQEYQKVVGELVGSSEEYCLILRPFGSDGEIVLPYSFGGAMTIEQVVARSARKALGVKAYAVVDQDRRLAPPGPAYVRISHSQWRPVVLQLIRRAHSIVIILPPGQGIRESLKWEIDQLTQHELQSRVILVVPPDRLYPVDYDRAFANACVLAATLEGFAGSVDDVDPLRVHDLELTAPPRTHVMKYIRSGKTVHPQLHWWYANRRRVAWIRFYLHALFQAFITVKRELSSLGFDARYPYHPRSS